MATALWIARSVQLSLSFRFKNGARTPPGFLRMRPFISFTCAFVSFFGRPVDFFPAPLSLHLALRRRVLWFLIAFATACWVGEVPSRFLTRRWLAIF